MKYTVTSIHMGYVDICTYGLKKVSTKNVKTMTSFTLALNSEVLRKLSR